jgi:hypothetical protein
VTSADGLFGHLIVQLSKFGSARQVAPITHSVKMKHHFLFCVRFLLDVLSFLQLKFMYLSQVGGAMRAHR